jgi:excisionase family DNA binding protein
MLEGASGRMRETAVTATSALSGREIRYPRRPGRPRKNEPPAPPQPVEHVRPDRRLLSVRDAAQYLGISSDTLRAMIERNVLRRVVLPGVHRVLVDIRDLDRLVDTA